jgi:hypothetical protein
MKKFTLFIALLVCAVGFSQRTSNVSSLGENNPVYAQSQKATQAVVKRVSQTYSTSNTFASDVVRGTDMNLGEAGTASNATRGVDVIITHSNTQTIEAGAEIACAGAAAYRDNSIYRDFDLAGEFGIAGDFVVTAAEIAIGAGVITPNGFPLFVNVYSAPVGSFPDESQLTLQGSADIIVTDADSETMLSLPLSAVIPAGEAMIYEVAIVDDGTETNFMRFGANNDGQTGISWIKADACGAPTPVDLNDFGLANAFVMNIIGDEDTGGGSDCSQANPSFAFENGRGFNAANGWTAANDIIVPTGNDMMLNQIVVNAFNNVGATISSADISIYEDNAGVPGTLITTETLAPTSETFVGSNFGFDIDELVFDITPVALAGDAAADVTYWVAVQVVTSDSGSAFWETSTDTAIGNGLAFSADAGTTWEIPDPLADGVYSFVAMCEPIGGGDGCVVEADFEDSALPSGWSTVVNSGTCDEWKFGSDLPTGPDFETIGIYFDDDDSCGEGSAGAPSNVSLLTDIYDNSGASFVTLEYDVAFQEVASGDTFLVEVYDGTDWQTVALYDTDIDPILNESIDATAYSNADFQVRFTYDDAGQWAWHAGIDNFCLDFDTSDGAPNDECANAIALSCGDTATGNTGDGTDSGGNSAADVWYSYTGSGDSELITVSLCDGGTDYDSVLRVWSDCDGTEEIAFNDDFCGLQSELSFTSDGTSTYYIMVEGFGGNVGNYSVALSCALGTNDNVIEGFTYYPNPATNVINLDAQSNIERVAVYNILGQKVIDQNINATSSQLNVANLATGAYLMEVSVDGKSATYKVVKN